MRALRLVGLVTVLMLSFRPALAVQPDEILANPALEGRARELSGQLRCLVCQNQSIDDSDAELARDLRLLVRKRISSGDTNEEVLAYIVDRYGEFVLLKPRFSARNLALWITPAIVLLIGVAGFYSVTRRYSNESSGSVALSSEEKRKIEKLLADGE